mmetsp:Transcript_71832/g.191701  ORF Transcript_71832/g.191701 Transcript_71832/m.191701 type:complete len:216 (-) Transcript_71832:3360-4007(-)
MIDCQQWERRCLQCIGPNVQICFSRGWCGRPGATSARSGSTRAVCADRACGWAWRTSTRFSGSRCRRERSRRRARRTRSARRGFGCGCLRRVTSFSRRGPSIAGSPSFRSLTLARLATLWTTMKKPITGFGSGGFTSRKNFPSRPEPRRTAVPMSCSSQITWIGWMDVLLCRPFGYISSWTLLLWLAANGRTMSASARERGIPFSRRCIHSILLS